MPSPIHESATVEDILNEGEAVDYESDTVFQAEDDPQPPIVVSRPERERTHTPNPFPERSAVNALTALRATPGLEPGIITNRLDQEQERLVAADDAHRKSMALASLPSRQDYVFRVPTIEVAGQSLSAWRTGSEATTPS